MLSMCNILHFRASPDAYVLGTHAKPSDELGRDTSPIYGEQTKILYIFHEFEPWWAA